MQSDGIMISGLGAMCAAGMDVAACMEGLYAGRRNVAPPKRIQADLGRTPPVFELAQVPEIPYRKSNPWIEKAPDGLLEDATLTSRMALTATMEALANSGIDPATLRGKRVGIAVGTTVGCTLNNEDFYRAWRDGAFPEISPVRRFLSNNPALFLGRILGLRGPVATVANACSSGADAIGLARSWLRSGMCDVALAGGADELSRVTYLGFASLMITSDEPCRPFDRRRTGLNLGEGAGMVVLEKERDLETRGGKALAQLAGYASYADAHHPTAPHPEGRGLRRAIEKVLSDAGIGPDQVGFCNAHGTSTPDNDKVEGKVLADLFAPSLPVVSTKACTGHTLGAAGGIEAVFAARGLIEGRLPANHGFEEADPDCGIEPLRENREIDARYAISNSLAFGGNNSVLLLERA
ncbi:MAG: beta-ketoacyl-[acyl-carrier-protein] synthase family protein [Candidatus Sumerlaeia bacterium]